MGSGFKPIAMEQQLAGDGQVTVMQAVPAGAGGQQVQVISLSKFCVSGTAVFFRAPHS